MRILSMYFASRARRLSPLPRIRRCGACWRCSLSTGSVPSSSHDGTTVDGIASERDIVRAFGERGATVMSELVTAICTAEVHTAANHTRSAGSYRTRLDCRHSTAFSCQSTSSSASFTRSPRHSKDDQAEYPAHQHVGDLEQHPASQAPPRPACRPERGFNYPNRVFERHTYTLVNLLPFAALGWLCLGVIATAILRARGLPASKPWARYSCQEKVNRQGLSGEIPVIGVLLFAVFLTGTRHRSGQPRRLQVRSSSDISVRSTLLTSSAPTRKTSVSSSWKTRKGPSR